MKSLLAFGRYLVRIDGASALQRSLRFDPECWLSAEPGNPDAVIQIEEGLDARENALPEGWLKRCAGAGAVCYAMNHPAFSLQMADAPIPRVTVRIGKAPGPHIRQGVQYGLMLALHRQCVGLHGVTLLCGDEIVLLSAPSGTGKTTLARLLEESCDAITVNGDFALLSPSEDGVIFEPTPFCGSSGRCLNHRLRVDRLVFLEQAPSDTWRELSGREALTRFMSNAFVPTWDGAARQQIQENAMRCLSALKVNAFAFAPTRAAAERFYGKLRFFDSNDS